MFDLFEDQPLKLSKKINCTTRCIIWVSLNKPFHAQWIMILHSFEEDEIAHATYTLRPPPPHTWGRVRSRTKVFFDFVSLCIIVYIYVIWSSTCVLANYISFSATRSLVSLSCYVPASLRFATEKRYLVCYFCVAVHVYMKMLRCIMQYNDCTYGVIELGIAVAPLVTHHVKQWVSCPLDKSTNSCNSIFYNLFLLNF